MDDVMPVRKCYTLITGSSSGIGQAIARQLSAERNLIIHGRDRERLEAAKNQCSNPAQHLIWQFDLKNVAQLADSLTAVLSENNLTVECFIHCAGMVTILPMRTVNHQSALTLLNVNVLSAIEIVSTLLKKKVNCQQLRSIIFMSSIWSNFGARGYSLYCASKGALDSLMRALAVELAPDIRVNSVLPGAVNTAMAAQGFNDPLIAEKLKQDYPLGPGEAQAVADAVEFLASEKARWITGQQLIVDGGRTVNMSLK
jgi:NAD(P)-dependent dehydrogenase (short-subunit alcohol dehydrogenase family)